jgi:LAGLIDADG endonuclease
MRDVNNGWILRYTHANVASFFFIFVYAQFYIYNIYFYLLFSKFNIYCYLFLKGFLNQTVDFFIPFLYFYISLYKKIMEDFLNMFKPSLSNIYKYKNINSNYPLCGDNDFLQWFSGFTDAEGSFKINIKNNKEVQFLFQITLHIKDVAVLYIIREKLNIGIVSIKGTTCSFRVHSFQVIVDNLLPIFNKYPLLTQKQLNYRDWKKAILLKKIAKENSCSLNMETFNKIINIKNSMNDLRTNYEGYTISRDMVTKNWLLGFVEGEGTFYFSNSTAVFGITQKDKQVLEAISLYLENIKILSPYKDLVIPNKPNCIIIHNKVTYQLVITDLDVLFQYICPFFRSLTFYSRKKIDFNIWSLGLYLMIYGYYTIPKGKELLLKLSNNMNSKRYFSNVIDFIDFKEIESIFNMEPPFNIHTGKSHFILAKKYDLSKGSRKGFKLYIYKNGKEITGSPFDSFRMVGKAIGISSVSSIRNYIDTGRIYKDIYTFYSKPIEANNL